MTSSAATVVLTDNFPEHTTFGAEFEFLLPADFPAGIRGLTMLATYLKDTSGIEVRAAPYSDKDARIWRVKPDSSVGAGRGAELVSRILKGKAGLKEVAALLAIAKEAKCRVDKSAGFHVHVGVGNLSDDAIKKICQQYLKYEGGINRFLPPSRVNNRYCKNNRPSDGTNKFHNGRIAGCVDRQALRREMSGGDRQMKFNTHNLSKPPGSRTLEFRQHSATYDQWKAACWIKFCVMFVHTSAKTAAPKALKPDNSSQLNKMAKVFKHVVKDEFLAMFYKSRAGQIEVRKRLGDDDEYKNKGVNAPTHTYLQHETGYLCESHKERKYEEGIEVILGVQDRKYGLILSPTPDGKVLIMGSNGFFWYAGDSRRVTSVKKTSQAPGTRWELRVRGEHITLQSSRDGYLCVHADGSINADGDGNSDDCIFKTKFKMKKQPTF